MSFIRLSLAFLLLPSICFALQTHPTTHDIVPLTKRAYNGSDGDWVGYLSARDQPYDHRPRTGPPPSNRGRSRTPRPHPPPSSSSSCDITKIWKDVEGSRPIKYGQDKNVFDVPYKIDGESVVIRAFAVVNHQDFMMKAAELAHIIRVGQFINWGREVIKEQRMEVWYVVQEKMGDAAETLGDKLPKVVIPTTRQYARQRYRRKYRIRLPPEFENEDDRYVYWEKNDIWYAEIVGWFGQKPTKMPELPEAEQVFIFSKSKHH